MTATWKPVAGYEGIYEVSDEGRVRSLDRFALNRSKPRKTHGRLLQPFTMPGGHQHLVLSRDGVQRGVHVHRLVAEAFVPGHQLGLEVCHNDGDAANNRAANLRWDTRKANAQDAIAHGTHHNAARTHCKHGHEFSAENTHIRQGRRKCSTCEAKRAEAYKQRRRAQARANKEQTA
jgi:hypothetical protein